MQLNNDFVGFRFEYDSNLGIDTLQNQNNKTYIVYIAQLYQSDQNNQVSFLLDIIDCTSPRLKGFKCLDFSKVQNYTFSLNTQDSLQTQINIFTYGCLDLDNFKTSVPDNCANQTEIDNLVNGINAVLRLKLLTTQFNTTSKEIQVNYRNAYVYTVANQSILSRVKTKKQISQVKTGLILQSEMSFTSPIEYDQSDQSLDRTYSAESIGLSCYSHVMIYPDEIVQQIQIQFPTLPQVFAQVNSIFTLLMLLGIIGRAVSSHSIRKDFIMLFLKNLYQSNYLQMLHLQKTSQQDERKKQNDPPQQHIQQQLLQQSLQVNQQQQKLIELSQAQDVINEEEATIIKDSDELNQSKQIPLFNFRPIFQSQKQQLQQNDSSNNMFQKQNSIIQEKKTSRKQDKKNQKQKSFIREDSSKIFNSQKDQFIQKQSIDDKQTLIVSDSAFSLKHQYTQQKSLFRDSIFNQSINYNLKDIDFVKNLSESQYKQHLEDLSLNFDQNQIQCLKKLKAIQDKDTSKKIQKLMFKFRLCKKRKKPEEADVLNQKQQQKIENQISQNLDILNFFDDMIFLKKAIMILLRKDQLAALKLVGFSPNILELDLKSIDANSQKKQNQLGYYEMQQAILQSEKLQQYQMEKFLKRCQNNHKLTQIDCRILQSLKANQIL
ncbi:AMP-binding enzyme family protein (macronuclear) [Tetrahymena thermophila SB210]|uniref:AMP-binding enzyme family protein n=1 Tax=Tetrahymena thermophila (strain SB210) TaxID=312017 RepID=Q229W0_TETTS|nr:AMP-binding enzyme family protein [Tetrahymena thermophila SB210]EAR82078.2 AMP-binding enzyme family protein [Tetrahymena thermophila SB210]|eukprot:XP_001029741.2 AMP-binding enzyme family protein [Tetrahymena thermophila SB210]